MNPASVFEKSPLPLFSCTPAGELLLANPACLRLWGCREAKGVFEVESLFGVLYPEEKTTDRLQRLLENAAGPVTVRGFGRTADGRRLEVEVTAEKDLTAGKTIVHGTVRDMTERAAWEYRLEKRIEQLVELNVLAAETAATEKPEELERLLVRRAVETLRVRTCLLFTYDENDEKLSLLAGENPPASLERGTNVATAENPAAAEALETGSVTRSREATAEESSASLFGGDSILYVPLRSRGRLVGLLTAADDAARVFDEEDIETAGLFGRQIAPFVENARLLEVARASEKRLSQIIDGIREGMMVLDRDGRIILWNRGAENIIGRETEEVVGHIFSEEGAPYAGRRICGILREALETGRPATVHNSEYETRDGRKLFLDYLIFPVAEGGLTAFFVDVTRRVETERERRRMEERLRALDRLESTGRLAGGIAHDFNNLLGVVLGHVSLIRGKIEADSPLDVRLRKVEQAAERAADLAKQLLAFARGGKYQVVPLDLRELCTEIIAMLRETTDPRIKLRFDAPASLPPIEGDRGQISQIVLNICINARDAMPEGGELSLRLTLEENAPPVLEDGRAPTQGPFILLSAKDTGIGMTEEVRTRVFEPFFSTKAAGKGTGLGLAVAYGVVKSHGGFIFTESEPGKGSTFRIYLPVKGATRAQIKKRPAAFPPARTTTTVFQPLRELPPLSADEQALRFPNRKKSPPQEKTANGREKTAGEGEL